MTRFSRNKQRESLPRPKGIAGKLLGTLNTHFTQHQSAAVDSLLRLLSEPLGSSLTWLVIGIALALPLSLMLLLQNLQQIGSTVNDNSTITLYLDKQSGPDELQALQLELGARQDIAETVFISATEALEEFQRNSSFGDVLQALDENPLPAVLLVLPSATDTNAIRLLRDELQAMPGVELAQIDLEWLQRLNAMVAFALRLAGLLALLLGLGVVLVTGNTVRMAIAYRRAEVVVTKLVGATDAYVARPFLYTGLWYGAGGGLVALLVVFFCLQSLRAPLSALMGAYGEDFVLAGLGISAGFFVVVISAALGWAGAWISVLRHLRAIEPR
jgi:cell division transport system permease protein